MTKKVRAHKGYYIPREVDLRSVAQSLLLEMIAQDERFQERAKELRERYPDFIGGAWIPSYILSLPSWARPIEWSSSNAGQDPGKVREYAQAIERLAQDFGLYCEWGAEAVHNLVSLPPGTWITPVATFFTPDPATITITVVVEYHPDTKWEDVKRVVLAEARRQFEADYKRVRKQHRLGQRDKFPNNLKRNVELLYKRICQGMGDLEIWKELDDKLEEEGKEGITYGTVREIISDTARLLGITLR